MEKKQFEKPLAYGSMTKEEFDAQIQAGLDDIKNGRVYTAEEVEAEMQRDFKIYS